MGDGIFESLTVLANHGYSSLADAIALRWASLQFKRNGDGAALAQLEADVKRLADTLSGMAS